MTFYNVAFGQNPLADAILSTLDLDRDKVGRFRDCFVANGEIAVYTRNGGGNRGCITRIDEDGIEPSAYDCNAPDCYACIIQHRLPAHPNYLRDEDDDYDFTYATIYFSFPERYKEFLSAIDTGKFEPDKRWLDFLEQMNTPGCEPPAAMVALAEKIAKALETDNGCSVIEV